MGRRLCSRAACWRDCRHLSVAPADPRSDLTRFARVRPRNSLDRHLCAVALHLREGPHSNMPALRLGRRVALLAAGGMVVVVGPGCHSPEPGQAHAQSLCRKALGSRLLNAAPATVADVRGYTEGRGITPVPNAFPGDSASAFAAWCWTKREQGVFTSYAVDVRGRKVFVGGVGVAAGTPSPGAPQIP
jgi:hypothetical protein